MAIPRNGSTKLDAYISHPGTALSYLGMQRVTDCIYNSLRWPRRHFAGNNDKTTRFSVSDIAMGVPHEMTDSRTVPNAR